MSSHVCYDRRYYLLVNRPESADTTFEWVDFAAKNNTELLNNLGNFLLRSLSFCRDKLASTVGAVTELTPVDQAFITEVTKQTREYIQFLEGTHIKSALQVCLFLHRMVL
jgi:methionyl-tRNA synthetase